MWIDPETGEVARTHSDVRILRPNWSGPAVITDDMIAALGFLPVTPIAPQYNGLSQVATELAPALVNGVWTQQWAISDMPAGQAAANLSAAQADVWDTIKSERDGPRTEGGVLVGGSWYHTDAASRTKWLGLKDSARDILAAGGATTDPIVIDGAEVQWKTMSGVFVPVTVQLSLDVVGATKVLDAQLFKVAEAHYANAKQLADPTAYDYSGDWPQRYTDTLKGSA